jgi:hypothetical protein
MSMDSFNTADAAAPGGQRRRAARDSFRERSQVEVVVRDSAGNVKAIARGHNLRVNGGADFWDAQLFKVATAGATANYIGLTTDATSPAAADTTLASEETTNGLARAQAVDTHSAGASSSQLAHTWTYTGSTSKTIAKVGLFNASSAGTMVLETLLGSTATVSANGDTITVTWTINF